MSDHSLPQNRLSARVTLQSFSSQLRARLSPLIFWQQDPQYPWKRASFIALVVAPVVVLALYLYGFASDQYVTEFRFRIQQAESTAPASLSPLAMLMAGGGMDGSATNSQIAVEYLQSRQVLDDLTGKADVDGIYGRSSADWFSRLDPNWPIEKKLQYWRSVCDPFFDISTGIVTVKLRAFDPQESARLSGAVLALAEQLVNRLSERAQADKVSYAIRMVRQKGDELKTAELALQQFRNRNGILLPQMQVGEDTGLEGKLREGVSQLRSNLDAMQKQGIASDAPQMRAARQQQSALESELSRLRSGVTGNSASPDRTVPLATLLTSYNRLEVQDQIATKAYEAALVAEQQARDRASQQGIYLDSFVLPAVPQQSLYPVRWRILLETALVCLVLWSLGLLLWRAVMDHIE